MLVNSHDYSFDFSIFEKGVQCAQNVALTILDRIYPINPYTQKRELFIELSWISSYIEKSDKDLVEWPKDKEVRRHTWKCPRSNQHFRAEALSSPPANNIKFHTVAQGVFDQIRKYIDQVAQDANATHYQFNYQFKILADQKVGAHTKQGGKIHLYSLYLEVMDAVSIKEYEFLSLEEKIAAALTHEFAHNCLGHTKPSYDELLIPSIPYLFFTPYSLSLLASNLSAFEKTYALAPPIQEASEALGLACKFFWALKGIALIPIGTKLADAYIRPFLQRQKERDADAYAIELLYQSGFDIRSAQYAMQLFIDLTKSAGKEDSYWWSTSAHPSYAERLNHATQIVESYHKKYGHYKKSTTN